MFRVFVSPSRPSTSAHRVSTAPSPLDRLTPYCDETADEPLDTPAEEPSEEPADEPRQLSAKARRLWAALGDRSRAGVLVAGLLGAALLPGLSPTAAHAAGTLTPLNSPDQPVQVVDHNVHVVINNGFARTEVVQTFFNPNAHDVEARYAFPVPHRASLAEFEMVSGETVLSGEVIERQRAEQVYRDEQALGREAALAQQEKQQRFEFLISPVRANDRTEIRFVYYQPVDLDTGVGRYVYPLQDGGTDERALAFWHSEEQVQGNFSIDVEVFSSWPLQALRTPAHDGRAVLTQRAEDEWHVRYDEPQATLNQDFVVYYRLADNLPGRVELLTHRDPSVDPDAAGTFMLVVTPGLDLGPITTGVDYSFVLDVSGSMSGPKVADLVDAMEQTIGRLNSQDRFRIVVFNNRAKRLHRGWLPADARGVQKGLDLVRRIQSDGGTNLYDGLALGLRDLDADRPTNVILVTDAETNVGVVDPAKFYELAQNVDVRLFGFVLGNGGNWPLMRTITEASGGYAKGVSTSDDLAGQILLASEKVTHEALHGVEWELDGVDAWGLTGDLVSKIYHGQQLVLFGRYEKPATGHLELLAQQTGRDRTFETWFDFPEIDTRHPELERLWALARIDEIQRQRDADLVPASEADPLVVELAVDAQLVTEATSMIVLRDEAFEEHGIERRNRERVRKERQAQAKRAQERAAGNNAVVTDASAPMFNRPAPSAGGSRGSGAVDGWMLLLIGAVALVGGRELFGR